MKKYFLLFFLLFNSIFCNPTNPKIIKGEINFDRLKEILNITQKTEKGIINWQDFSIKENEKTRFILPSEKAATLNRVIGDNISKIYGSLQSNGKIFLINEKGILLGPNSNINTKDLVLSTLNLSNEEFLNGNKYKFCSSSDGKIINEGTIVSDGNVIIISKEIQNKGIIKANNTASLSASDEVILIDANDTSIKIKLDSLGSISQEGKIEAAKVELKAAKGNLYSLAIKQTGIIEATDVKEEKGRIFLCSEAETEISGSIKANNGSIHLLGENIKINKDAKIDASSFLNGNEILIGGDYQGKNPEIKNAKTLLVEKGSIINASSKKQGKGGKIILWSDEATQFYGDILAKGGDEIGDGGFVEVSSKNYLDFQGFVKASAINGKNGELLLDPYNITITAISDQNITGSPNFYPTASPSVLTPATIVALLDAGTDVSVSTSGGGGAENGDITISSAISWGTGAGSLTLNADNDIAIDANITCSSNASFIANAERTINVTTGVTIQNTYNGASSFPTNGAIYLNAKGTVNGTYRGINLDGATITSVKGNIKLEGKGGDTLHNNYGIALIRTSIVSSTGAGTITIIGTASASAAGAYNHGLFLNITSGITSFSSGNINITATGGGADQYNRGINMANGSYISSSTGTATIDITTTGGNGTNLNHGILVSGTDSKITSENGNITINATGNGLGTDNYGIYIYGGAAISSTGTATIDITSNGGTSGTNNNYGLYVTGTNSITSSVSGSISIEANGGGNGTGTNNYGLYITDSGSITSTGTATITIEATGGNGTNYNYGIYLKDNDAISEITSQNGNITITATGNGTGIENHGLYVYNAGSISSTGTATMNITATGANGTNYNYGLYVNGTDSEIISSTGNITINATGNGTGIRNYGISIINSGLISSSGSAQINITTVGGSGTNYNYGLFISISSAAIISSNGNITVTATGGAGSGEENLGIAISTSGKIQSTGAATITINAVGGNGTNNNYGLQISGINSVVTSVNGNITITGTGGAGSGTSNFGVYLNTSGSITSTGSADINLTGTGKSTDGYGVYLDSSSITLSNSGNLNILANALDASTTDFQFSATSSIGSATASGDFTITADTLSFLGSFLTSGNVILQPYNTTASIGLGTGASGTFNLNDIEIVQLTNDNHNSITIGRTNGSHDIILGTGGVTTYDFSNSALILRGDTIEINNQVNSGTQDVTFYVGQTSNGNLTLNSLINTTGTFTVYGGNYNDIFYMTQPTQTAVIDGVLGRNTVQGSNSNNTWTLSGTNSGILGTTITFSNITDVTGGSANDTFYMISGNTMIGIVNGGSSSWNILDYTQYGRDAYYSLVFGVATGLGGIRNINQVLGARYGAVFSEASYKLFNGLTLRSFYLFIFSPLKYFYRDELFPDFSIYIIEDGILKEFKVYKTFKKSDYNGPIILI